MKTYVFSKLLGAIVFSTVISVVYLPLAEARRSIELHSALTSSLNDLLAMTSELHDYLYQGDEALIKAALQSTLEHIQKAEQASRVEAEHHRSHLVKILSAIKAQFEMTQASDGEQRIHSLKRGFAQLSNLTRIYKLDPSYMIFFCSKDKSSWVQSGRKPKNPFNPDKWGDCGRRVH